MKIILTIVFLSFIFVGLSAQNSTIPEDYKLVFQEDFEKGDAIDRFEMSDPKAWKVSAKEGNKTLELFGESKYRARVRSPFNIALIKDLMVGDFILEVDLAQSGREYGHRDLCLFFSAKDATNFYYVHMATTADDHANNIFLVNDEPRIKIARTTSSGTDWGATDSWHKARIHREVESGLIRIYFDNMKAPVMVAEDTHFDIGRIGFGSFDDTGRFDNIKIWAPSSYGEKEGFFQQKP